MSVTFRSKQPYLQVAHEELFHIGEVIKPCDYSGNWYSEEAKLEFEKLPDPDRVNSSYLFCEGEKHNEITLEREDAIAGMREYIKKRGDWLIVELSPDGKALEEPGGTIFECKTPWYNLTPAIYTGKTPADGKTFVFNQGEEQNCYVTSNLEEIKLLRGYIKTLADKSIYEVK